MWHKLGKANITNVYVAGGFTTCMIILVFKIRLSANTNQRTREMIKEPVARDSPLSGVLQECGAEGR